MKTRYWFTNDNGDNLGSDFVGTLEGAINHAEIIALRYKQDIAINEGEDIIDWVYYEELANNGYDIKPVIHLGEDNKYEKFILVFNAKKPMTKTQALEQIKSYILGNKLTDEDIIADKLVHEYELYKKI